MSFCLMLSHLESLRGSSVAPPSKNTFLEVRRGTIA